MLQRMTMNTETKLVSASCHWSRSSPDSTLGVFAQGDYVGYGMHGDFTNGWPVGTLAEIWKYGAQCSVSGIISNCPTLQAANQNGNGSNCIPEKLMVDEEIGENGPLTALPG